MLIILTGKTASGKDTVKEAFLAKYPNFKRVTTSTSRAPREGEKDGIDYYFLSKKEFEEKLNNNEFLEYVEYGGNYYGTESSQIKPGEDLIWKIDPSMAGKAKQVFPESIIIYITTDDEIVLRRLKERGFSNEETERRMQDDQKFWDLYHDKYDYIVENAPGKLEETLEKIISIIENHIQI